MKERGAKIIVTDEDEKILQNKGIIDDPQLSKRKNLRCCEILGQKSKPKIHK
jgi:hypothetical protein